MGVRGRLCLALLIAAPGAVFASRAAASDFVALPGMTEAETRAYALWSVRAGLNVAALQCQFSKSHRTVDNYNAFLRQHSDELAGAYKALGAYFTRTAGKGKAGVKSFDSFSTRVYQNYVAFDSQYSFCDFAADVGRRALSVPKGNASTFAVGEVQAFRSSLQKTQRQFDGLAMNLGWVSVPDVATLCGRKRC